MDDETDTTADTGPDADVLAAKIAELETAIAERDAAIADRDAEIVRWKAANYDLLMQIPGDDTESVADDTLGPDDDGDGPDIDDLFD